MGISKKGLGAYTLIAKGIRQGWSATKILNELRKAGLGYTREVFLKDLNIIKDEVTRRFVNPVFDSDGRLNSKVAVKRNFARGERYRFIVKYSGFNEALNQEESDYITIYSDRLQTEDELLDSVERAMRQRQDDASKNVIVDRVDVVRVEEKEQEVLV